MARSLGELANTFLRKMQPANNFTNLWYLIFLISISGYTYNSRTTAFSGMSAQGRFQSWLHSYTLPFSFRALAQFSTELSLAQAAEVG